MLAEAAGPPLTVRPSTLAEMLLEITTRCPDHRAFVSMYQPSTLYETQSETVKDDYLTWTYRQLDNKGEDLAASLAARGICSGMHIAVALPNSAEWALLWWASVKLGTTFVPLDDRAVSRKDLMDHFLRILKPTALFVSDAAHASILLENHPLEMDAIAIRAVTDPNPSHLNGWQNLKELLAEGANSNQQNPTNQGALNALIPTDEPSKIPTINGRGEEYKGQKENDLDSILYILFTSGVSGLPKACPISNRNAWACAMAGGSFDHGDHTDVMLINAPPSHSMSVSAIFRTWFRGATVVIPSPAFDAKITIETIDKMKCTHTSGTLSFRWDAH